ncbi:MAG: EVE domain-containing protein [Hyphomonas sp.]|uniref:EVE domain-containing protein n=1 Tax=Hyphomonas sp. TaxID=87 RepID=UPI0034A03241
MQHWLLKSEPDAWSWDQQVAKGEAGEIWSGVRNYTARNHMRAMKLGDRAFFYHSNEGLAVVGVVEVCALSAPDPTTDDLRWDCVTVKALEPLPKPVTLKAVKENPRLVEMSLVKSFRLSVQPVLASEWKEVCRMGGMDPKLLKAAG